MGLFDLLFLLLTFTSLGALFTAGIFAIGKQPARALRIVRRCAVGLALYFAAVILVSLFLPRRVLPLGDPVCFDDWCIAPQHVDRSASHRASSSNATSYKLTLQLSSRARRVPQREKNLVLYLTDVHGVRYDPIPQSDDIPFNVLLGPGESITATRTFQLPVAVHDPGLVIAHQGGFPIAWLIIGYESWFRKPTIIRLPR